MVSFTNRHAICRQIKWLAVLNTMPERVNSFDFKPSVFFDWYSFSQIENKTAKIVNQWFFFLSFQRAHYFRNIITTINTEYSCVYSNGHLSIWAAAAWLANEKNIRLPRGPESITKDKRTSISIYNKYICINLHVMCACEQSKTTMRGLCACVGACKGAWVCVRVGEWVNVYVHGNHRRSLHTAFYILSVPFITLFRAFSDRIKCRCRLRDLLCAVPPRSARARSDRIIYLKGFPFHFSSANKKRITRSAQSVR